MIDGNFPPKKLMRVYNGLRQLYSSVAQSTIYALSTPPGRSAIAVIRVSGPSTRKAITP